MAEVIFIPSCGSRHFDASAAIRRLPPGAAIEVTIASSGLPAAEAAPVIGEVRLFAVSQ